MDSAKDNYRRTLLPNEFGPRLRLLRINRGLGLNELARRLNYSNSHVSKIENGHQKPTVQFARRCDAELGTGSTLSALVPPPAPHDLPEPAVHHEPWQYALAAMSPQSGWTVSVSRSDSAGIDDQLSRHLEIFAAIRELGQIASPATVLPMATAQAQVLREMAVRSGGRPPLRLATLAARVAEYTGWMAQEAGSDHKAVWWTNEAVEVAVAAGDDYVASYALVRRGLIALYRGDAAATIALAREAQSKRGVPHRVLGLAAQREAQGHALAGDYDACMRAINRARDHLANASTDQPPGPTIGTAHGSDPVGVVTGWCLYDLGRPRAALEILDREVPRIPPGAVRARTRFGARRALSCAASGELDQACALTRAIVADAARIDSATIRSDLGRLAMCLRRWHGHAEVRALEPALSLALHRSR